MFRRSYHCLKLTSIVRSTDFFAPELNGYNTIKPNNEMYLKIQKNYPRSNVVKNTKKSSAIFS
ncbi:MAG: hypothetical protein EAZ93_12510 [Oscillatoriales cyanobacterium]|nr:MAG: hypothetical protein EAZ93_12510 [Oscillatoriales cyanobacterium]